MVTYTQIAGQAGVSIAAVSRAYTPGASVSAKMLGKISLAAKQLGHPLPPLPLVGIGLPPLDVGIVAGQLPTEWQPELLDALNQSANHWNIQLHRLPTEFLPDNPDALISKVDGVLLLNGNTDMYQALTTLGKPWLESLCLKENQQHHRQSIVTVDHFAIGQWMGDRLIQAGYSWVYGVIAGSDRPDVRQLYRGVSQVFKQSKTIWLPIRLANHRQQTIRRWLSDLGAINNAGFCVFDDYTATNLRQALEQLGILLPRDAGLLAFSHESSRLNDTSRLVLPMQDLMISALELLRGQIINRDRKPELRLMPPGEVAGNTHLYDRGERN